MKVYKKAAVADPLSNYTLLDYEFELINSYVEWFDTEHVPQVAWNIDDAVMEHSDNEYVDNEDEVTDDKGSENGDSNGGDDDDVDDQDWQALCTFHYLILV